MKKSFVTAGCMAALMFPLLGPVAAAEEAGGEQALEEVVVTATRTPVSQADSPQSVAVVDRRDIEIAGGRLDRALDRLPAVRLNWTGSRFMAALPTIRGSQPGEVLVLVNGRRLNSQQSGWFNLADLPIPAGLIERVEVLQDSSSALYGAEAMGGVINIITREPAAAPWPRAQVSLSGGSHDTWGGELGVSGGGKLGSAALGFSRRVSDGYRDNGDAAETRYNLHLSQAGDAYVLDLSADVLRKKMGSPGPESYPTPSARQHDDTWVYGLKWQYEPSKDFNLTADGFWNHFRREYRDPPSLQHSRHLTAASGGSLQSVYACPLTGRWSAGLEYIRDEVDSTNDGVHHLTREGVFLQDEFSLSKSWTLVLTGRYDAFSLFEDQFSPRAAVVYKAGPGLSVRASAARGYRTPTFDDLYWSDPYAHGNPDLDPERSWNYELGLSGRPAGWLSWNLDLFRRDVEDLINWQDRDGDWVWTPENIAAARISGASASMELSCAGCIDFRLGYTYLDPEDLDRDRPIEGRPKHMVKLGLDLLSKWLEASLDASWVERYAAANLDDLNYLTTALRLGKTMESGRAGRFTLSLEVDNLLDEEYETVPGYPMPGREYTVELSWAF